MAVIRNYILKQSFYQVGFRIIAKLTNNRLAPPNFSMKGQDASPGNPKDGIAVSKLTRGKQSILIFRLIFFDFYVGKDVTFPVFIV